MSGIFRFKQFHVDQTGCAMKINTDGVLLGALAGVRDPKTILDIGTGTGVIALMLAQRFEKAVIDAVEVDQSAANTADANFRNSPFAGRLFLYAMGFGGYFDQYPEKKYDLVVSNPPFYINSLKSPQKDRQLAKHADDCFFDKLLGAVSDHLEDRGLFMLILPVDTATLVIALAAKYHLFLQKAIRISSFYNTPPHRVILSLGLKQESAGQTALTIYKAEGIYTEDYAKLLQPYFIAF
jgi:tRNA1Val (adenine37-N6)-methyltransferase